MGFKYYKTFDKDGLADAAVFEDSWTVDEDLKIKRVHIVEKSGTPLTKSTFYLKIKGNVYTQPLIPASILGPDILVSAPLEIDFKNGTKLDFTLKNLQGADIDVFIIFECWEPE